MTSFRVLLLCFVSTSFAADGRKNESSPTKDEGVLLDVPYCFRFTWIGPEFDEDTKIQNLTCKDRLKESEDIPCTRPLVATNNSNIPDTSWMWENYKSKPNDVACKLTGGDVCVKYSYIYDKAVENITYMCSKVRIDGEGPVQPGCYSEFRNGRELQVCVCRSIPGRMPCNRAEWNHSNTILFTIFLITIFTALFNT